MAADDPTMLLDYAFSTDPAPMQVSTTQVTNQARVNISAGSGFNLVYCNQIVVSVPVGPDTLSLFAQPPAGSTNTNKWALTTKQQKGAELCPGLDADQDYTSFIYDCDASDYLIDYNLVFGVFGAVNSVVGDVAIKIQENSGTTPDPSTFTTKCGVFTLRKDPPEFYLANLVAATLGTPTVPCTDFPAGVPFRLAWESNGTYFQLFEKGQTEPVYSGTATTCLVKGGISRGTTFFLAASMTGSPGEDQPQGGYQPIYLYDSLAISVSNPELTPTSVTVSGALGVTGTSTLGTTNTGALTSASATVTGGLSVTGGTLNVAGPAAVNGGLSVTGGSTLDRAAVSGTLTGTGSAALNNLTVTGLSGSSGHVALFGPPTMIAQNTTIEQNTVQALTDGFAVALVLAPDTVPAPPETVTAYGMISVGGTWFQVQGGTTVQTGTKAYAMINNPNAITIPVQAGAKWSYAANNSPGNTGDSTVQIWWFPLGGGSSGKQTFRMLSAEELAASPPPPLPPAVNTIADRDAATTAAATDFVDRLAKAMKTTLSDESRSGLVQSLRRL